MVTIRFAVFSLALCCFAGSVWVDALPVSTEEASPSKPVGDTKKPNEGAKEPGEGAAAYGPDDRDYRYLGYPYYGTYGPRYPSYGPYGFPNHALFYGYPQWHRYNLFGYNYYPGGEPEEYQTESSGSDEQKTVGDSRNPEESKSS
uniref:Putative secreted mucin n=1 Tax=Amblyomma triste TaxID=251400 RepID=A0A023G2X9_AMBTT